MWILNKQLYRLVIIHIVVFVRFYSGSRLGTSSLAVCILLPFSLFSESSKFLRSVQQTMDVLLLRMPDKFTFTELLDKWVSYRSTDTHFSLSNISQTAPSPIPPLAHPPQSSPPHPPFYPAIFSLTPAYQATQFHPLPILLPTHFLCLLFKARYFCTPNPHYLRVLLKHGMEI